MLGADSEGIVKDSRNTVRRRLLLVEDDADCTQAFVELLKIAGYDVDTAGDGSAAEVALNCCPDFAVVDLGLPDGNGTEVVSRLVAQGVHVIAFSGWHHLRGGALSAGADAFVPKPDVAELMRVLAELETDIPERKDRSRSRA